ncbi:MAG: isocitrate/isopropylmalate family dehydrogenase [Pseudomonadota bacterium]
MADPRVSVIPGDGIGVEVTEAALAVVDAALGTQGVALTYQTIAGGAGYFQETGKDIEPGGEARAGEADAIFLGAIGLPTVRHADGTEISPHLRLRDRYGLYAGVRPVKAYPTAPQRLADPRAAGIDLVILRESTEGLFYSAAVHGRSREEDDAVYDTLRISGDVSRRLFRFGFDLAARRRGRITCVDKANVFRSMAFFRDLFDAEAAANPGLTADHAYVDAMALNLVREPWDYDVLVMENMFGDILSDLAGGLVGGMGMAACGEIGDEIGLFQPAHGSAPDIIGQDAANPLAAILSGALMLDDLARRGAGDRYGAAAGAINRAVDAGFSEGAIRPKEFGGPMGTRAVAAAVLARLG